MLPGYVKIEDHKSLARHMGSMAVVNTDTAEAVRYRSRRDKILGEKAALVNANAQIDLLRGEVAELRELFQSCVARKIK